MWIPAHQRWPNTSAAPINIETQRVTRLRRLQPVFILMQVFFSLCLHPKTNTLLTVYTPGRCVLYGTGSRDSGPSLRTSPGRRNIACRHFSLRCRGWGVHGRKWDLWEEEMVRCVGRGRIWENIWRKSFINCKHFLFITCWRIQNIYKHQNLYISAI